MSYIADHKRKFADLKINISKQDQLRKGANGGNSILFSYPPLDEISYINEAKNIFKEEAQFIDISKLFVDFIENFGWEDFEEYLLDFSSTPHIVFHSYDPTIDLFDLIINAIQEASDANRIPFLIRTGCLHGTGIDNVNIMENKKIMGLKHPLVIFYPSKVVDENILFLNIKPASKYRCTLIK